MKPKKLLALVFLVLALAGAAALKAATDRRAAERAGDVVETRRLNEGLSPSFVSRVELERSGEPAVVLTKNPAGEWSVESRFGVPARKAAVEELVNAFANLSGEVRASSPDLAADFKLDEKSAIRASFRDAAGKEVVRLYLSPLRPNRIDNFVRAEGSNEALAVKKDILSTLGIWSKESKLDYKTFADLRAVRFDLAKVTRAEVAGTKGAFALVRAADPKDVAAAHAKWTIEPGGSPADAAAVSRFLVFLSNVYGSDAVDPAAYLGYSKDPAIRVLEGEKETLIYLGTPAGSAPTIKLLPDRRAYEVSPETAAGFKKTKAEFAHAAGKAS